MPKPMSMTIEVEEIAFGKIFRTLDGMPGVVNIKISGSGPKAVAGASGNSSSVTKRGGAHTVPCIVLGTLMDAKTPLGRAELGPALEANGKRATSLPDALSKLRKEKAVTSIGKGHDVKYKITAIGVKQYQTACNIQE